MDAAKHSKKTRQLLREEIARGESMRFHVTRKTMKHLALPIGLLAFALGAAPAATAQNLEIPYKKFTLDNGLQVIVHEDHSDPIVAVYVSYHVGSAREEPGRSGFAHLFEHMLFQGSQHVGDDQHFKMVSEAGGTLNGTTNLDRTLYFETLPANFLELALWLEADRMGFLLPAVTLDKLNNQRDVVKNERRQNYENRPYAQGEGALVAALYPPDHPYSWVTIGSMADLSAASLEDVHNFFRRWYGPNNATLAIGGDIDTDKALALAKKYFGGIPAGPKVDPPAARPTKLDINKRIVMEDNVQLPQITLCWPTVDQKHGDDAALTLLASVLAQGKTSILEKALRMDENLARNVSANQDSAEIAGQFTITVTAAPNVTLDSLETKVLQLLQNVAEKGVDAEMLQRIKTRLETGFVRRMESVGSKTSSLCVGNMFTGNPNDAADELKKTLAVTADEITNSLKKYILNKTNIVLSVVPKGKIQLAASGRTAEQQKMETTFDRNAKPGAGPVPTIQTPVVWHDTLQNGVKVVGTKYTEIPITTLSLAVPAGHLYESMDKLGLASLTAACMNEGTKKLNTLQFTEAVEAIGANLNVNADDDEITITLSVLNKNLPAAIALMKDVLLEPRFDEKDFNRIKKQRLLAIDTRGENIGRTAGAVWQRLQFGDTTPLGLPSTGTKETVTKLTIDDVKNFHGERMAPAGARLTFVGALDNNGVKELFNDMNNAWKAKSSNAPIAANASAARPSETTNKLYLVDKAGAAQSEIRIGHEGVAMGDPDHFPLTVLNYILGGAFSSRINMNLREAKGYTYGARSNFESGLRTGVFTASGGVHTQFTKESVVEFMKELKNILNGVTEEELAFAKNALARNFALQYESANARLGMAGNISKFGFPDNYPTERMARLEKLTLADLKTLAEKYLHPDRMTILVVGDKEKIGKGLSELGYGVVELDIDGAKK